MTLFVSHFPVADAMNTLWILAVIILGLSLRKYVYLFTELGNQYTQKHLFRESFPCYYTDKWPILIVMYNYPNISLIPEERTKVFSLSVQDSSVCVKNRRETVKRGCINDRQCHLRLSRENVVLRTRWLFERVGSQAMFHCTAQKQ